jgi:hypothetical protein
MGLFAAADIGEDAEKFTEKEKGYALELAKAAKAGGDTVFSPLSEEKISETLSRYEKLKPTEFFKPGERELRAGEFLRRTSLGGYTYEDYLGGRKAPAVISARPFKTAPAAAPAPTPAPTPSAPPAKIEPTVPTLPSSIELKARPTFKAASEYSKELEPFQSAEHIDVFRKL